MGNKIVSTKKAKKLTSAELRKKKKVKITWPTQKIFYRNILTSIFQDRMARRKRGEEYVPPFITQAARMLTISRVFSDEDD
jgi:hypothetical protein